MPPAFDSPKQAAAFALLLVLLVSAPWLSARKWLPQPGQTDGTESIRWEKLPWMQQFIEETNDIDIAFVGSSHMLHGIWTPYVQQKLDERLGRKTVVRSICFRYSGFDFVYFIAQTLLTHRHVKTLVFDDECWANEPAEFHALVPYWFRWSDDRGVLAGLPRREQGVYYFAAILGMPRYVLSIVAPNLPGDPDFWRADPIELQSDLPADNLGCMGVHLDCDLSGSSPDTNFTPYIPPVRISSGDVCIFSPATAGDFAFSEPTLPLNQIYFARQLGALAKAKGCHLVELHLPMYLDIQSPTMTESRNWTALADTGGCLLGIPNGRLFAGLGKLDIEKLFYDPNHLNKNGQQYFTALITPALIQFYESHAHP